MSTDIRLRYSRATATPRPAGSRQLVGYSPKLERRVALYSRHAFEQWLLLESDPSVVAFCERPVVLTTAQGAKLADFWVHRETREEFLVLGEGSRTDSVAIVDATIAVCRVPPTELAAARTWTSNWEHMLPVINASMGGVRTSLEQDILRFLGSPRPLMQIERRYAIGDPSLVRACVFGLLREGHIVAPQLHSEVLSMTTSFAIAPQ